MKCLFQIVFVAWVVYSIFPFKSNKLKICSVVNALQQVKRKCLEDRVLAVLGMGKISEKGIMKEGY